MILFLRLELILLFNIPKGVFEPTLCNNNKCKSTTPVIAKGNKKCKEKNLFKVGLSTELPPQINSTYSGPIQGIALNKLVITVAKS